MSKAQRKQLVSALEPMASMVRVGRAMAKTEGGAWWRFMARAAAWHEGHLGRAPRGWRAVS